MDTWCGTPSLGTPDAPSTWYVSASGLSCTTEVGSPITVVTSSVVSSSSSASDSMISCQSSAGTGAVVAALVQELQISQLFVGWIQIRRLGIAVVLVGTARKPHTGLLDQMRLLYAAVAHLHQKGR